MYVSTDRSGSTFSGQEKNEISLTREGFRVNSPMFGMGNVSVAGNGSYTAKTDDEIIFYRGNGGIIRLPSSIPIGKHLKIFNWLGNVMGLSVSGGASIYKPAKDSGSSCGVIRPGHDYYEPGGRRSYDVYRINTITVSDGTDDQGQAITGPTSCGWVIIEY